MDAKTIGTHSGSFHVDEALACFILKQLPEYKDATIIRSRDPQVLSTLDILVDVGAEYDPARNRFDHHQRGFTETLDIDHDIIEYFILHLWRVLYFNNKCPIIVFYIQKFLPFLLKMINHLEVFISRIVVFAPNSLTLIIQQF